MIYLFRVKLFAVVILGLFSLSFVSAQNYTSETLFYIGHGREALADFKAHADQISIICPASYQIDSGGVITGDIDPRILTIAAENGVKVMPLFASFSQTGVHQIVSTPAAREEAIRLMLFDARKYHYYGWHMDLENVSYRDRDAYTSFFRQSADSLHKYGFVLSMAIVKSEQPAPQAGNAAYQGFLYENWDGAFDIPAIAEAADFISFMSYDQQTALTPPGPVAGMPWMERMAKYLNELGIPPEKISWGIPSYSDYWYPTVTPKDGARSTRDEISYADALDLLDRYQVKTQWMADQQVNYAYWENNGVFNWLFLEDAKAFVPKFQIAKRNRYRGISVWLLGTEDQHIWPVLKKEAKTKRVK